VNAGVRSAARLIGLLFLSTSAFYGYSALTHEAIVDAVWDSSIQKMLLMCRIWVQSSPYPRIAGSE